MNTGVPQYVIIVIKITAEVNNQKHFSTKNIEKCGVVVKTHIQTSFSYRRQMFRY